MPSPHEIVGSPYVVYVAPEGSTFPALSEDPLNVSGWELLGGSSGSKRYGEDGITVNISQEINAWTPAGSTMPVKAFRTSEASQIQVPELANMSVDQVAKILDRAGTTQTTNSGTPDTIETPLQRGPDVAVYTVLARGASPSDNTLSAQFQIPRAYQDGNLEMQFTKGTPAVLNATFGILDPETREADYKYIAEQAA